jgi:hypothetical protein
MNPIQLNQLRNYLNRSGVYFKLMADIDLMDFLNDENPSQGWQPVGSSSAPFKGIVDGNGKNVSGLWIKRPETYDVGLFGYTNGATIKNLKIVANTIEGQNNVGGMSGSSVNSTFSGCSFTGTVKGVTCVGGYIGSGGNNMILSDNLAKVSVTGTGDQVGGFIGRNEADNNLSISNCLLNEGMVTGVNYVGGCCGINTGYHLSSNSISDTYIHANITGNNYVGGICGSSENQCRAINLSSCGYVGNMMGDSYVGGLVGYNKKKNNYKNTNNLENIQNSFALSTIAANGDYVGGLVGYEKGYNSSYRNNISNCYFNGSVSGGNQVGGLIGYKQYGTVSKCYASARISGKEYVGGLVGTLDESTLNTSVAINTRISATDGMVSRIVGQDWGYIGAMGSTTENKSYNRTIVIDQGVAQDVGDDEFNGTGVSATTLKLKATYVAMGWDFTDIWAIQETESYPYMKTQTAPPVITSQVISNTTTVSGKCVDGGTVTLDIDGMKQKKVSTGQEFSFTVSPLQAGHEVRLSAKADGKEQSYFTMEAVAYLGKGTEADPYQVYTASDLTGVYRKGYFKLMNDIDLTSYINQFSPTEGWESIGREGSETIHFDGNGHKIIGLWCNSTRNNTGLFSCFANGTIKNLTVETASGKQVKGGSNTAILIGKIVNCSIENCCVSGNVADGTPVGGMVGMLEGGTITRCQANITISTTLEKTYAGGMVGEIMSGTIDQCATNGALTATGSESYVGGLVGKNSGTVSNCYSMAKVTSSYNAAGLIAYNYGYVVKSYATGNLYSQNYAAGVIGYNDGERAVIGSCAAMNNKIEVVYESQQVQQGGGYGQRIIGGIKNGAPAPDMNNYALKTMQLSVNDVAQKVYDDIMNGTAKTSTELTKKTTYQELGWDMTSVWTIVEGKSYPTLQNDENNGGNEDDPGTITVGNNSLFGNNLQASSGKTTVLSVMMTNEDEVKLCQFDLQLPNGVTVAKKSNGKLDAKLTERAETHSISSQQLSNGNFRFIISSMDNDSFTGNSGTLVEITLDIPATMEAGEYTVKLLNAELSVPDGTDLKVVKPADTESKLIVKAYTPGDVNNDGSVSVTDVGCTINYILEQVPSVFIFEAADMNGDKSVSVTDVGMIINLILNDGAASRQRGQQNIEDVHLSLMPTTGGYRLMLENKDAFVGFQFDVKLADGATLNNIQLNNDNDHLLTYRKLGNGIYRVVCYSPTNSSFAGEETALLNISTIGDIAISNIRLTTTGLTELRPSFSDGMSTGIASVEQGIQVSVQCNTLRITSDCDTTLRLYSLGGSVCRILNVHRGINSFDGLRAGVYMIGNRKVILR